MEEVIAVSFHDRRQTAQAFNLLWQMNDKLAIELDDAVVVHRDRSGNLEYDQDVASTLGRPLIRAGFWGALLGALVPVSMAVVANVVLDPATLCGCALVGVLICIIGGASKAAAEATWWKEHFCASRCLPPEVIDGLAPHDSAVIAWIDSAGLEMAAHAFRGIGGKVVRTTLPPEEVANLEAVSKG